MHLQVEILWRNINWYLGDSPRIWSLGTAMERVVVVFGCLAVLGLVPVALGQNEAIGNATSDSLTPVQMASSSILVPLQHRFTLNCSLTEPSLIPEEDLYHLQMVLYIDQINATQKLASWEKFSKCRAQFFTTK